MEGKHRWARFRSSKISNTALKRAVIYLRKAKEASCSPRFVLMMAASYYDYEQRMPVTGHAARYDLSMAAI
jgi:hypothetical protein